MIGKKMQSVEIIDNMSREQVRDYWYELKQMRYDGYYFRELYEKILKMNPHLVLPDKEEINRIEKDALSIAFWEENWEITNERRIKNGGVDYSILKCNCIRQKKMPEHRVTADEHAYFRRKVL
ncbi:MAG: hypothetical protein KFF73_16780 [Cyclobacteriaceae bacterium]|nr:hypothetical protein [Cyclobacteriaceae bacterium]